ncbi:polysaccharide deacetylase family sporulation protein PdaB [Melghiribacillus thermohalophilus]|uniref:Polysaccharide deacetylase family sporulation protein PdaB n=1 Tax=Melghiribacillus thermohalophilus TaxID=1324956 RepID=A0A4V2V2W6_9BACI|nr:polysaccharide deacetylase family protein [Melghiribacillus thermohalophilus]TCT26721.1 polysaccharide deacetylase family sporulation protein PdaB [Melghiribacillus thermohalophilus]
MAKKYVLQTFIFLILVGISYTTMSNPYTDHYVSVMKNLSVTAVDKNDPLYQEITDRASDYEKKPQNARMDHVWKKIPGLEGRKVDIEKSYARMKKKGNFDENLIVFEHIKPRVSLEDLPPGPIYRGNPEKRMVSFLINVSWGNEYIPSMLETLKDHHVKATFFLEGKWARDHVDLVKMIAEEGHEIGNHAYNHPDMKNLNRTQIQQQISRTNEIIEAITGEKPKFFAPPSGAFNETVVQVAHELNMETILWTVDTIDWRNPEKSVLINRVLSKVSPGSMILMHPTEVTSESLDQLVLKIKEKEYKIGTVTKLLSEKR